MIAHIVIATWKPGVTEEQIGKVKTELDELTSKVPEITEVQWYETVEDEEGDEGVAVIIMAKTLDAIDEYHALPGHAPFAERVASLASSISGRSYEA